MSPPDHLNLPEDTGIAPAGADSPHLDEGQQRQAERAAPLGPLVIHEIVREQGEIELQRSFRGLAFSGIAAGLSIGFSMVMQAYLQANLPDAPWRHAVAALGYSLGFLIVILGRQQLFTETTLTALIPALTRRSPGAVLGTMRVWAIVLAANILGTFAFAAISAQPGVFSDPAQHAMATLGTEVMGHPFWQTMIRGLSAGWLIGLMVWLLPAAGAARPFIVIILTYAIALCGFPHIIAGSVESAFAVVSGVAGPVGYLWRFFLPTLVGNVLGGTILAALFNHAQVADELHGADA